MPPRRTAGSTRGVRRLSPVGGSRSRRVWKRSLSFKMPPSRTNRGRQTALFGPELPTVPARATDRPQRLRMLVTVKAAPNPSTTYGETVCVAGISADVADPGWIRLYPINFRYLQQDVRFRKYDLITVVATPARRDARAESWRPDMSTLVVSQTLPAWKRRRLGSTRTSRNRCVRSIDPLRPTSMPAHLVS